MSGHQHLVQCMLMQEGVIACTSPTLVGPGSLNVLGPGVVLYAACVMQHAQLTVCCATVLFRRH